jgi:hypothetical protein
LKKTIAHQRIEGKVCQNTIVGMKRKKAETPFCGVWKRDRRGNIYVAKKRSKPTVIKEKAGA